MRVPAPGGSRQCSCTAASGRSLALTLPEPGRADGPRGRVPGATAAWRGDGSSCRARPVARSMAARRAVAILVSGSRAAGHAPPRSTPSRRGCLARGVLMDVLQLSKSGQRTLGRVDRAPSHAATSNSLFDELNLLPNIRTVQAPRLPLPDHVHGLVSLDRSPRRVEFTKALLGRHASFDRAPSCAGSPAGRWSPRR